MKYLHLLTGLRGLAALIVFIAHSADKGHIPKIFGWGFGQIGVMLFFILSGFLMSHLYIQKEANYSNIRRYALARIARVIPLFLAALIISYIISNYFYTGFAYNFQDPGQFLRALFFIHAPYVFWTIPVEIQFYFVFVIFWWLYQKHVNAWILGGFIVLTLLPSAIFYELYRKLPEVFSAYSYAFFIGVITALLYRHLKENRKLKKLADWAGLPFAILLFVNMPELRLELGLTFSENVYLRTWADPVSWVIIYGLFVSALFNSKSLSFLAWRPFVFIGEISYGIYLLHYPFLQHINFVPLGSAGNVLISLGLTITLAYLSFRFFEKPVALYIRNTRWFEKKNNCQTTKAVEQLGSSKTVSH